MSGQLLARQLPSVNRSKIIYHHWKKWAYHIASYSSIMHWKTSLHVWGQLLQSHYLYLLTLPGVVANKPRSSAGFYRPLSLNSTYRYLPFCTSRRRREVLTDFAWVIDCDVFALFHRRPALLFLQVLLDELERLLFTSYALQQVRHLDAGITLDHIYLEGVELSIGSLMAVCLVSF